MGTGQDEGYAIPARYWRWAGTRWALQVLLWLIALAIGVHHWNQARSWFRPSIGMPEHERRADDDGGHATIDFGGQWIMGRMIVTGNGRELYHRQRQWEVTRAGYPVNDEAAITQIDALIPGSARRFATPDQDLRHDVDRLMYWFMGSDPPAWKTVGGAAVAPLGLDPLSALVVERAAAEVVTPAVIAETAKPAIGGPLYPPVHGLFYSPLALIERPQTAYFVFQLIALAAAYLAGLGVSKLSGGRVWWSAASACILLYPGCRGGIDLGQNPTLTLAILVWGWALLVRGRAFTGGLVWSLLAYKPVWAAAFLLVPLLMGRWRFLAGMVLGGGFWIAATLPLVGIDSWFHWLEVGKEASALYNVNENWIMLSRDLHGIPRRILHDFKSPEADRDTSLAKSLAWGLWGAVFGTTIVLYLWRGRNRRQPTGTAVAFVFLGAFLSCYRFMYYDVLLSAIGVTVLFAHPTRFLRTRVFAIDLTPSTPTIPTQTRELTAPRTPTNPLGPRAIGYLNSIPVTLLCALMVWDNFLLGADLQLSLGFGYFAHSSPSSTVIQTPKVQANTSLVSPGDTLLILLLWIWCGWQLLCMREDAPDLEGGLTLQNSLPR